MSDPSRHRWEFMGSREDHSYDITYFLWHCRQCGRSAARSIAAKGISHMWSRMCPDVRSLQDSNVNEDCRQAMVDGVHAQ